MSAPVCYLERSDRGDRLVGVRLVGHRLDEHWVAPSVDDALGTPGEAARWVAAALADRSERHLALVCVDPDGALCSWLSPPSTDHRVVESLVRRSGGQTLLGGEGSGSSFADDGTGSSATIAPEIDQPGSGAVQVLTPPKQGRPARSKGEQQTDANDRQRLTVLAMRDAPVRLFLDALDDAGVRVGAVDTIWQALAAAWDPAGAVEAGRSTALHQTLAQTDAIVGESDLVTAIVLIDPAGRLVWVWSSRGVPSACGSMRLERDRQGEAQTAVVRPADVGRLTNEWLAWAAQLGDPPARIVCLVPSSDAADTQTGDARADDTILDPAALGRALGEAWADASVSMAVMDDPIGETLERLSPLRVEAISPPDDPSRALVELSNRPGRAHRAMYRWTALALVLTGVVLMIAAWRLFDHASATGLIAMDAKAQAREIYRGHISQPMPVSRAVLAMRQMVVDEQLASSAPSDLERAMPVLDELSNLLWTVSYYGTQGLDLIEITIDRLSVRLTVEVPTTEMYEDFEGSLEAGVSHVGSWNSRLTQIGSGEETRLRLSFTGTWAPEDGP